MTTQIDKNYIINKLEDETTFFDDDLNAFDFLNKMAEKFLNKIVKEIQAEFVDKAELDNYRFNYYESMGSWAEEKIDETGFLNKAGKQLLDFYIDYEGLGEDMAMDLPISWLHSGGKQFVFLEEI